MVFNKPVSLDKKSWLLLLIFIFGLLLRIYNLGTKSLWFDEVSNIANAVKDLNFILLPVYSYKPAYILLLKVWVGLFGISAVATRMLSVFFGALAIVFIYKIGKKLFNSGVGLISALLLSISCFHIYHSQQVAQFSFLVFLVLLSVFYFIKFINDGKVVNLLVNLVLNILIIYSHPYGITMIPVQYSYIIASYVFLNEKINLKKWLIYQTPLLLTLVLLLAILVKVRQHLEACLWWASAPGANELIETFKTFSYGGPRYGLSDVRIETAPRIIAMSLVFVFGVLLVKGMYSIFKKRLFLKPTTYLLLNWLLLPPMLGVLFSRVFFPVYFIKHFIIILPAFYMIVSVGIYWLNKSLRIVTMVLIIILNVVPLKIMFANNVHVDWGKAVYSLKSFGLRQDAVIVVSSCKEVVPFMYYFAEDNKASLKEVDMFGRLNNGEWEEVFPYKNNLIVTIGREIYGERKYDCSYMTADLEKKLIANKIIGSKKQVWLLISRWISQPECPGLMVSQLGKYFTLKLEKDSGGVRILRLE